MAEKNTFGLPRGDAIRKGLREVFRAQRVQVLAALRPGRKDRAADDALPDDVPELELGALKVSERMTPLVSALWEQGGRKLFGRVGVDPDRWEVVNPHTADKIRRASLAFCEATNRTTTRQLGRALDDTREELIAGVVTRGESVAKLTDRVNGVFDQAERWRARAIAQTEASRAVHAAQEAAAVETGQVAGWEWLLSGDACPLCQTLHRRAKFVKLGDPFAVIGHNADYSEVRHPPGHPHCNCSMIEVLKPEYGGPKSVPWSPTLIQPKPEAQDYPDGVAPGPKPKPAAGGTPEAPKPAGRRRRWVPVTALTASAASVLVPRLLPALLPLDRVAPAAADFVGNWAAQTPLLPGKPVRERIAAYLASDQGKARLQALKSVDRSYLDALAEKAMAEYRAQQAVKAVPHGSRADDPAVKAAEEALAKAEAAGAAHRAAKARTRKAVASALAIETAGLAELAPVVQAGHPAAGAIADGGEFLGKVVADSKVPKRKKLKLRYRVARGEKARSYYEEGSDKTFIAPPDGPEDVIHEFGHLLEDQWRDVSRSAVAFLEYRTAGEPAQRLARLFPGRDYRAEEAGRKDRFEDAMGSEEMAYYTGKDYKTALHTAGRYPTEVLAKGLEQLARDPVGFAAKDPEYCGWVLGILDGSLR